jgi:hypothetical protein
MGRKGGEEEEEEEEEREDGDAPERGRSASTFREYEGPAPLRTAVRAVPRDRYLFLRASAEPFSSSGHLKTIISHPTMLFSCITRRRNVKPVARRVPIIRHYTVIRENTPRMTAPRSPASSRSPRSCYGTIVLRIHVSEILE